MKPSTRVRGSRLSTAVLLASVAGALAHIIQPSGELQLRAASSAGCEGGGFTVTTAGGVFGGEVETELDASTLGARILVRGRYVEFDIVSSTFAIENYFLTGAPNVLDITGGVRTAMVPAR